MFNTVYAIDLEASCALSYGDHKPKVTALPFVKKVGKGKNKSICYWHVKPTGDLVTDRIIGKYYAIEALQFMLANPRHSLLSSIVHDMPRKMKRCSVIQSGFWSIINDQINCGGLVKVCQR